jgi:ankyrin repeat protein
MKAQKNNSLRVISKITLLAVLLIIASCKTKEGSAQGDGEATSTKPDVKPPQIDIHTAVLTENAEALKQHIAAGTDINEKDPFGGSSPLITASLFGKTEMAKLLIDAGADVNFQNNDESTALHVAAFFCRPDVVKLLLEKGADKSLKNKYGQTPYDMVAGPFSEMKPAYDMMVQVLGPMGLKLDYTYLEKTRPQIAATLK